MLSDRQDNHVPANPLVFYFLFLIITLLFFLLCFLPFSPVSISSGTDPNAWFLSSHVKDFPSTLGPTTNWKSSFARVYTQSHAKLTRCGRFDLKQFRHRFAWQGTWHTTFVFDWITYGTLCHCTRQLPCTCTSTSRESTAIRLGIHSYLYKIQYITSMTMYVYLHQYRIHSHLAVQRTYTGIAIQ